MAAAAAPNNISKFASPKAHHVASQAASVHSHSDSCRNATSKSHMAAATSRREHNKSRGTPVTGRNRNKIIGKPCFVLAFAAQHEGYLYSL